MKEQAQNLSHFERYKNLMNSSLGDKFNYIIPHFPKDIEKEGSTIVGIGAGTGKLEHSLKTALPDSTVIALDYSTPMIEEIIGQNSHQEKKAETLPLLADAKNIPFKENSLSVIIASSVIHELCSFGDGYQLGTTANNFFREAARTLKPGGRLIIRDFMQPPNPDEIISLKIGAKKEPTDTDPIQFIYDYIREFKGDDLNYLTKQIIKPLSSGMILSIKASHALELTTHYSWSKRFNDEVKEKYAYLPTTEYAQHVHSQFQKSGISASIVSANQHLQPGYPEHIDGRLDLLNLDDTKYPFSPITGIIVIEKTNSSYFSKSVISQIFYFLNS